jgi:hypothetical protein
VSLPLHRKSPRPYRAAETLIPDGSVFGEQAKEAYESAVITTRRKSDIYELTLRAMALSEKRDVQVREIAKHASYLTGDELRPEKFSNALGELVKPEHKRVLTKVRDGYYKFTSPLMRPYLRFLLEYDNLTYHQGQLEFPFMRTE